jgi:hypothetical protein
MTEPVRPSGTPGAGKAPLDPRTNGSQGMRPALPAACRTALRASAGGERGVGGSAHEACPRCASIASFQQRFAPLLAKRPAPPPELASRAFLDAVLERIVDVSATGTQQWLRLPPHAADPAWPEELLESPVAASIVANAPRPPMSTASWDQSWDQLRRTILADVDAHQVLRVRRGWLLGLVATAAAALTVSLLLVDDTPAQPTIVFADLDSAPGVDFSILRYGALQTRPN